MVKREKWKSELTSPHPPWHCAFSTIPMLSGGKEGETLHWWLYDAPHCQLDQISIKTALVEGAGKVFWIPVLWPFWPSLSQSSSFHCSDQSVIQKPGDLHNDDDADVVDGDDVVRCIGCTGLPCITALRILGPICKRWVPQRQTFHRDYIFLKWR